MVRRWRSGESARLPPMWPGFDSQSRCHMWVGFVVGSRPCSEMFFSGYFGFPLSSKINTSKFQLDLGARTLSNEVFRAPKCFVGRNKLHLHLLGTNLSTKRHTKWCCQVSSYASSVRLKRHRVNLFNYSQTGCSFPCNFANFRRNIGILIDNLLGAICNRYEQLARFSLQISLCTFLGRLLLKSENWACTTKKLTKAALLGTSEVGCCNNFVN